MSERKLYATIVPNPDVEAEFCCDLDLIPNMRVFLYHVDHWGYIVYHFTSKEQDHKWIVRVKTDDAQFTRHVGITLNPAVVYGRYDNEDER